jgi:hypothetical protein
MGMEPAATREERERKTAGWGDEVDEGGELAAAHLFPPPTRKSFPFDRYSQSETKLYARGDHYSTYASLRRKSLFQ